MYGVTHKTHTIPIFRHNPTAIAHHIIPLPPTLVVLTDAPLSTLAVLFLSSSVVHKNSVCANSPSSPFLFPLLSEKKVKNNGMVAVLQDEYDTCDNVDVDVYGVVEYDSSVAFARDILREKTGGVVGQPRVGREEKFNAER